MYYKLNNVSWVGATIKLDSKCYLLELMSKKNRLMAKVLIVCN